MMINLPNNLKDLCLELNGNFLGYNEDNIKYIFQDMKLLYKLEKLTLYLSDNYLG